ncbi:bifunctional nicotinamide-nucleotide adenylyltransferase/Nudix hydroxylase [Moraxella catarrhalis]|uniref:bifunctional nicotinamide-nucleotide adenylyltransferase/Nudix hydroxylase n=1 Tax=Moraxella catarrhalis TaxID=480 RepID=UPI000EA9D742|nr:bifunctional nicotinamide-nucleotide adenylyltransferase/Nudix hydroxylase [Moraxella catarrhalis]MPW73214.1 cytidyltransferase [Moraxella catarrhalis]MPX05169.1 bifunctional nicotinamide-nucleotide adenylyltransferase/Nudix hydroxylase [Moraxella catarrhalis]RKL76852.1 bifunctional nicotinamide-nucleotide adenylyltransferase/Nudix hydroxylase [Moraxella catarrhalis]RKM11404.1 bifunctional nicotinamide-nucleotide adenylyltransferase/Nudix hydroxylase [Moraxella catarrhalis]RKM13382.1 bifunc
MHSSQQFDYLIFIGRFEPFHQGHHYVITQALAHARQVIVLMGSANSPRTIKNPFRPDERQAMILNSFGKKNRERIHCLGINDATYNDNKWLIEVQNAIVSITANTPNERIGIIGHDKDESSYYLALFPQYKTFMVKNFEYISATPIREAYFGDDSAKKQASFSQLTKACVEFLTAFEHTKAYHRLKQEYQHIQAYQAAWQTAPYPPNFITSDALIVQSGHILLIERGGEYGQGLYALPGGFVDTNEDFYQACLREVHEETNLDISLLKNSLITATLFDAPKRSQRARTVTMVYYFELPKQQTLPDVQAGDDANRAFWLPLSELNAVQMFEDHYGIICQLLKI